MDMSLGKLQELVMDREPGVLQSMGLQELDTTEWLNWTELNWATNTNTSMYKICNLRYVTYM